MFTDQVLIRKYGEQSPLKLLAMDGLALAPFAVAALLYAIAQSEPLDTNPKAVAWCAVASLSFVAAMLPYYKILSEEEALNITPFYRLTPVFVFIYGYVLFSEEITFVQGLGATLLILLSFLYSWHWQKSRLLWRPLFFVSLSCAAMGLNAVASRQSGLLIGPELTTVYFMVGYGGIAILIVLLSTQTRGHCIKMITLDRCRAYGWLLFNNVLFSASLLASNYAYTNAPAAGLVNAVNGGVQPFFALLFTPLVARLAPSYFKNIVWDKQQRLRLLLLAFMFGAVFLVYNGS